MCVAPDKALKGRLARGFVNEPRIVGASFRASLNSADTTKVKT